MDRGGERSVARTHLPALDALPLEEVLADHLLHPETPDFGLEFEDERVAVSPAVRCDISDAASQPAAAASRQTSPGTALSDEDLARVLGWPDASPSPSSSSSPSRAESTPGREGRNRRGTPRHSLSVRASVRVRPDAAETVQLRNISSGGICALHARPLRPGDFFQLTLRTPDPRGTFDACDTRAAILARPIHRRCTVLRCEPGGTGKAMFNIAAQFVG